MVAQSTKSCGFCRTLSASQRLISEIHALLNIRFSVLLFGLLVFSVGCRTKVTGPPFAPKEALTTFRLPEGFRIELVAAEPDVTDPVAIAFDPQGRIYAVEMIDYPDDREPEGRIRLLEDRDGDGRFETSFVFADGFHFPTGVMPWKEGILVAAAPDIFYLADTDGDHRADKRQVLLSGFNPFNPQLRVNGLLYGIDNWIYGAYPKYGPSRRNPEQFGKPGSPLHFPDHPEVPPVDIAQLGTDFRFRPDQLKIEPAAGNSQYGNTFNERQHRFGLWNNNHIRHMVIENKYLERNPYQSVSSAMQFPSDHENQSIVLPDHGAPDLHPRIAGRDVHFGLRQHRLRGWEFSGAVRPFLFRLRAGPQPGAQRPAEPQRRHLRRAASCGQSRVPGFDRWLV